MGAIARKLGLRLKEKTVWLATLCALLMIGAGPSLNISGILSGGEVWGQEKSYQGIEAVIVAAVGYENETGSVITVKVYDADSGTVLSDGAYELIVKDDQDGHTSASTAKIFAGGTGIEAADQSSILLRVYDAETGTFQWVGRLHFDQLESDNGGAYPVAMTTPRRATLTRIENMERSATAQPLFVLRAWDVLTGTLLWEDTFIPEQQVYPVARKADCWKAGGKSDHAGDMVDLQILMVDQERGEIVWQDQMVKAWGDRVTPPSPEEYLPRLPDGPTRLSTS